MRTETVAPVDSFFNQKLVALIVLLQLNACCGSRRMSAELKRRGFNVGQYRARSLMKEADIEADMPKPPTTPKVGGKADKASPNLLSRALTVESPMQYLPVTLVKIMSRL